MASTYLTRAASGSVTSQTTYTFSFWIKRNLTGVRDTVFMHENASGHTQKLDLHFDNNDNWLIGHYDGTNEYNVKTNMKFRDCNGWYHIVTRIDTTQSTESDRYRIYVNGNQVDLTESGSGYPAQNSTLNLGQHPLVYGRYQASSPSGYFSGGLSHCHYCDGQSYAPTEFGQYDANGVWTIKTSPSVTYGTNGHFMFKDNNSVNDQSGNSNNFTVAGGTLTNTEDNPSNVFATFNPLIGRHNNGNYIQPDWSNGNLTGTAHGSAWRILKSTLGASSGKYYAEFKWISDSNTRYAYVGIYDEDDYANKATGYPYMGDMANGYGYYSETGDYWNNGSNTSFGNSFSSSGDGIQGVALDLDNSKLYFSSNGVWQGGGNPSNGTGGISITANKTYTFGLQLYSVGSIVYSANFGNGYFGTTAVSSAGTNASGIGIFEYDVPTGYTALSTKGLNL